MIIDTGEHRESAEPLLRQAVHLTPAEARLVLALARGDDLKAFVRTEGIGRDGPHAVKAILTRTATHR